MRYLLFMWLLLAASCEILEEDISRQEVNVVAPADNITVEAGRVDFRWLAMERISGYEFTLVGPSFSAAERVVVDTVIYADTLDRRFGCRVMLDEGKYEWSVSGFNAGYKTCTQIRSLHVIAPATPEVFDILGNSARCCTGQSKLLTAFETANSSGISMPPHIL